MKTITTLLFVLLAIINFSSCKEYNKKSDQFTNSNFTKSKKNINNDNMDTIKRFDIEQYKKNSPKGLSYSFTDSAGNSILQFRTHDLYVEHIKNSEELFYRNNEYDIRTGILVRTGLCQKNGGMQYGIWKSYDTDGNLIKEIDYEKPYKYTWEDILQFIKKENIDLNAPFTLILRANSIIDGKYWLISWNTKQNTDKPTRRVHLDGDSGKIIFDDYFEAEEY